MRRQSVYITVIYIVLAAIWLVLGNEWIENFDRGTPGQDMSFLYNYKNYIFLVVSGTVLFLLIEIYNRNLSSIEKNYKKLFEGSPASIYVFDKESYRFLEVNEVMVKKYGYTRKELLGMTIFDIRPEGESDQLKNYLDREHVEGHETGVWLHKKKHGEVFRMLISHHSTIYGGKPAFTVVAIDVERRIKAEEKIKELLDVYETVTSVTNDVIWEYNLNTDHLNWMNGFAEIFGYTEELRGNTKAWVLDKVHPDDRTRVSDSIEESYLKASNSWRAEYRFLCADGIYKYVSNQAFIIADPAGKPQKLVGALRDITIRKNYEERLLLKNQMLKDIAWKNSHELRRPVSNIIGIVGLLKTDAERNQTDAAMLEMLARSAAELDEIITKINASTTDFDLKN